MCAWACIPSRHPQLIGAASHTKAEHQWASRVASHGRCAWPVGPPPSLVCVLAQVCVCGRHAPSPTRGDKTCSLGLEAPCGYGLCWPTRPFTRACRAHALRACGTDAHVAPFSPWHGWGQEGVSVGVRGRALAHMGVRGGARALEVTCMITCVQLLLLALVPKARGCLPLVMFADGWHTDQLLLTMIHIFCEEPLVHENGPPLRGIHPRCPRPPARPAILSHLLVRPPICPPAPR